MGLIINPRGTSGAGKTEFVRQIVSEYMRSNGGRLGKIYRDGRDRPIVYRLPHPLGGRPLAVLGHYEATAGGCDTIGGADGGMDEVFRLADGYACRGHDVLLEGLLVSGEYGRSAALAKAHDLHVICLSTPVDQCIRNAIVRRRSRRSAWPQIERNVTAEHMNVESACRQLGEYATVELLDFNAGLLRARHRLGLTRVQAAA
jgi:hypothetical protein